MFYSDNILTRKGPLANIWLAAHWDRRLTKAQIVQTNIEISVHDIVNGALPPMALRLSGQLLLGVSKIYGRKARYLLEDCADALSRLKLAFTPSNVDLPAHASKASHATITLPTIANLDDALAPEPELDLDALLRETATAPTKTAAQPMKRPNLEYDAPNLNFGLGPAKEDELPSEFQMDVEFGRRATMDGNLISDPLRQSIEVGRRAESPRPSLPFSPLRTPTKNVDFDFEQVPLNEDFGYFDEPPMPNAAPEDRLSAPPAPEPSMTIARQTRVRRARSIKPVSLDDETEISNNFIQECVRDSTPILLAKPSWNGHSLAESLRLLSIEAPARPKAMAAIEPASERNFEDQVPLNEDDYALGPADFAMEADVPMPRSPKSPRIMNDENAVPDFNRSITNSPTKQRTASLSLSDESLDIIAVWQQAFQDKSTRSLQFDKLVPITQRKQIADSFLQLLILQTKGLVVSNQQVPFGAITVKPTNALFNATSEVLKLS